ncbi:MAG TPA: sigma-70 family RNA polymerase sigma factor [Thermoanaerobaculia bacterium]|jgi:RNA polymerase sigma-70 factor|nr:sigma-70 family RNA polymerase sigma factor [Thermoanaerobaculia bacterium]
MTVDLQSHAVSLVCSFFDAGRARFGDLQFDAVAYAAHVETICNRRLDDSVRADSFVESLHGADLYLAFGCLLGRSAAWQAFEEEFHEYIVRLAVSAARTPDEAIDLAQAVVVDLFLPDRSGRSRIGSYDGRSSLATWLRVLVCHRAINERKRNHMAAQPLEALFEAPDETAMPRLDATIRAHRYSDAARDALQQACAKLSARERHVLLLRYGRLKQVQEIAAALCVHPSNVTRQIDRVCNRLREIVIRTLQKEYGLSSSAIEECLAELVENPSYEILSLLESAESCLQPTSTSN